MESRSLALSDELYEYVTSHSEEPDEVQRRLIDKTAALGPVARMQIGPDQGAFMGIIVGALQPHFAIEIGTFTGYSSLAIAKALPAGGKLLCCDVSTEWTAIATEHWEAAGVADRIELRIGPGLETIRSLPAHPPVDFAFIDADKTSYVDYYEELLPRLSQGGLLAVDNTLWSGAVIDEEDTSDNTVAIRRFNDHVAADGRSEVVMLSIGDGLTLIRRR